MAEKKKKPLKFKLSKAAETGAPKLVDMTCSHCGGALRMLDETHAACPFCGASFLIDEPEDVHVNIYLPDHSEGWRKFGKVFRISAIVVGVLAVCAVLSLLLVSAPAWLFSQKVDPVVQAFYEDVLGDAYRNLSKQDYDRIKYISVLDVKRNKDGSTYYIAYSFDDYADHDSDAAFLATVRYWSKSVDSYNSNLNFSKLHGLTFVDLRGNRYLYPKDAPVTCVKADDLNMVTKQICGDSDEKKSRIEKMDIGMEYFVNLEEIQDYPNLRELKMTVTVLDRKETVIDLRPLTKCRKLEKLSVTSSCSYVGLAELGELKSLRELSLPEATVEQSTFLAKLPQLESLSMGGGEKGDMRNLQGLTHLRTLNITRGNCKLSEMPELEELELFSCEVESQEEFDEIARFPSLKQCSIRFDQSDSKAWDVSALGELENLKYVELYSFGTPEIVHLECALNLKELEGLKIWTKTPRHRKVSVDMATLSDEISVKNLYLSRCYLRDTDTNEEIFEVLSRFRDLETLTLHDCELEDICMLGTLGNLQKVNVEENHISDFSPLANCPKLQQLYLGGNPILEPELPDTVEIFSAVTLYGGNVGK